jgi:DNA-binding CsgD family transcriptional regulator
LPENRVDVIALDERRTEMIITPPTEAAAAPAEGLRLASSDGATAVALRTLVAERAGFAEQRQRFSAAVDMLTSDALAGAALAEYLAGACETLLALLESTHCGIWATPEGASPSGPRMVAWAGAPPPWLEGRRYPLCSGYELDVPAGTDLTLARPLFSWLTRRIRTSVGPTTAGAIQQADAWGLSPRQREVLLLLVTGEGNRAIAARLGCSVGTIEQHVSAVLERSRLASRAEVLRACLMAPTGAVSPVRAAG